MRSFLTLLGVIFGVMTVVAVASVIEGFFRYVDRTVTADLGTNTVIVDKFGMITSFDEYLQALRRNKDLTTDDLDFLRERLTLATNLGAQGSTSAEVRAGGEKLTRINIRGNSAGMINIDTTQAEYGRYISEVDDERRRSVALIGSEVADKLFNRRDVVGREVKINGLPFEVIGVAKENGAAFGQSRDDFVIIPLTVYQKMWGSRESLSLWVRAASGADLAPLQDQIRMHLRARHRDPYQEKDTFGLVTAEAVNNFVQAIFGIIAAVALGITSISLVVGGIVIMNIMLVTVTERTREIGIRKSLGARRRDILMQFLIESTTLSLFGGLIGLGIAVLISRILVAFTPVPAELPIWAGFLAIGVSSA
ncbi:MAG: ABC transporter permease, partial [Acidobacteriota bacterium]